MKDREWPQNLDAERAVLGSMLIQNEGYLLIAKLLPASAFYRKAHRDIFSAAVHLLDAGKALDFTTLLEELKRRGIDDDVGGPSYVSALVDGMPRSTNIRYYAEIVQEKAARRALMKLGDRLVTEAGTGELEARELIQRCDADLTTLAGNYQASTGAISVADCMPAMNARLAKRIERRGQLAGISSGLSKLDLFTHGWQRRKMIVIAAQTSFGKSVLGLQMAMAIAGAGERVIYYSLEMPKEDLIERAWAMLSGIPLTQIIWGNIRTDNEFRRLAEAQERFAALPLEINDSPSTSITDMRGECRQVRADRGLGAVVVDYFQRMDIPNGDNRAQKLGEVSRQFYDLVGNLEITGFMLSQITVDGKEAHQEPNLEHLKDCKQLGHDCDMCLMLHPYKPSEIRTDTPVVAMKGLIRKQRGGHLGLITLDFERDYVRFVEGEPPAPPVKEPKAKAEPQKTPTVW